jgi:hypothetical protein
MAFSIARFVTSTFGDHSREQAEAELEVMLRDEPGWEDTVEVVAVPLATSVN